MRKKFLPFTLPYITKDEIRAVTDSLKSGWITTGPKTKKFEEMFKKYIGCKYAIAVNSGTSALHLALTTIGLKEGDEVIVPTMTFAATAEVVVHCNAIPVFIDCEKDDYCLDATQIERNITKRTKAIIPVHYGGQACDIDKILRIAKKYKLRVIWDAAHSLPTKYKNKLVGTFPDITCFSFYATKTITTGEGGMITTNNKKWADEMRLLSLHGMSRNAWKRYTSTGNWYYEIIAPGYKYNMSDMVAAMGLAQLKKINWMKNKREKIAQVYNKEFKKLPQLTIPTIRKYSNSSWHLYPLRLNLDKLKINRDKFIQKLREKNIGTSVHFIPLHLHPFYRKSYGYRPLDFPNAYNLYRRTITLPIYPKMTENDIKDVVKAVREVANKFKK